MPKTVLCHLYQIFDFSCLFDPLCNGQYTMYLAKKLTLKQIMAMESSNMNIQCVYIGQQHYIELIYAHVYLLIPF